MSGHYRWFVLEWHVSRLAGILDAVWWVPPLHVVGPNTGPVDTIVAALVVLDVLPLVKEWPSWQMWPIILTFTKKYHSPWLARPRTYSAFCFGFCFYIGWLALGNRWLLHIGYENRGVYWSETTLNYRIMVWITLLLLWIMLCGRSQIKEYKFLDKTRILGVQSSLLEVSK